MESGVVPNGGVVRKGGVVCKWLIYCELMVLIPLEFGGIKVVNYLIIRTFRTTVE